MTAMSTIAAIASLGLLALSPLSASSQPEEKAFAQVQRPGSVDLEDEYDLDALSIPRDQIHTLLPRDAIPALTDPKLVAWIEADYLDAGDRVIDITIGSDSVAVPLKVLNYHEIANLVVGGEAVAATYCPLCDSVTVFSRSVSVVPEDQMGEMDEPQEITLEFGVSGALYNSNVLMYDRTHKALWSQLGLSAVSGPLAGTRLSMLPVRVITLAEFTIKNPAGLVLSDDTGHERPYSQDPYQRYFDDQDRLLVPVASHGDALPKKTLGLGLVVGDEAFFVASSVIGERFVISTTLGDVVASSGDAGVRVLSAPDGAMSVQSFYYSFSAFHPHVVVKNESD